MNTKKILFLITFCAFACRQQHDTLQTASENTVFKLGAKINGVYIKPRSNSGFIMKINDVTAPLYLTAHHVAAARGNNTSYQWDELADKNPNAWIQSMQDSTYWLELKENLPIRGAETLKLDLAAYHLPADDGISFLTPSKTPARVGDTVTLFSVIDYQGNKTLRNPGVVTFVSDSLVVYKLLNFHMARIMSGTSGSAVVNKNNEVVSNSVGAFTIPNSEVRESMAKEFPLIGKLDIIDGKSYGFGVPVKMIVNSIDDALRESKKDINEGKNATND